MTGSEVVFGHKLGEVCEAFHVQRSFQVETLRDATETVAIWTTTSSLNAWTPIKAAKKHVFGMIAPEMWTCSSVSLLTWCCACVFVLPLWCLMLYSFPAEDYLQHSLQVFFFVLFMYSCRSLPEVEPEVAACCQHYFMRKPSVSVRSGSNSMWPADAWLCLSAEVGSTKHTSSAHSAENVTPEDSRTHTQAASPASNLNNMHVHLQAWLVNNRLQLCVCACVCVNRKHVCTSTVD